MKKFENAAPATALVILGLFRRKLYHLEMEEFDTLFDAIVEELEKLNNERYRLWPDSNLPDGTDGQESPL